jgi:uncharacterized protein (TIGR02145 family)
MAAVVAALPATPAITRVSAATVCLNTNVVFRVTTPVAGATYTWGGTAGTASGTGSGTLTVSGAATGTKSVTVYARVAYGAEICQSNTSGAVAAVVTGGTAPGATVNFTAFNPCSVAATGATWTLQDTRESGNNQNYKVKKMADGHIWMVQDMKFGNLCGTTFNGSSATDQTGKVSSIGTYYGDCTAATSTATPANRGYLYDWAAAIQKSGAYSGSSSDVGCSGTASGISGTVPGACRGICPEGWHIPTGGSSGEFQVLHTIGNCSTSNDDCWNAASAWEGVLGGFCFSNGSLANQGYNYNYWSSTYINTSNAYCLSFISSSVNPGTNDPNKNLGISVRCIRNY